VFATGYSPEAVDPRFIDIQVFQKPIDRQALESYFMGRAGPAMKELSEGRRTSAAG
jgi:hypothetical protein